MGQKIISKKIMGLVFFVTIVSITMRAGEKLSDALFIKEAQDLIKEVGVGLQPSQHAVVTVCVVNCKDAAQQAQFLIKKSVDNTVYGLSLKSVVVGSSELPNLQLPCTPKEKFVTVSHWIKFKWAAVGASACAIVCGVVSWLASAFTT